jgi:predicted ribosome-associated RNA-binding protein Tma20
MAESLEEEDELIALGKSDSRFLGVGEGEAGEARIQVSQKGAVVRRERVPRQ